MGLCCRGTYHLSPCRLLRVLVPIACGGMHEKWFRARPLGGARSEWKGEKAQPDTAFAFG